MFQGSPISKIFILGLSLLLLLAIQPAQAVSPGVVPTSSNTAIDVTTTNDKLNVNCGAVKIEDLSSLNTVSLREAICAANNTTGADTINLPKGVYTLDRAGIGEDANKTGDLDIKDNLTIIGSGGDPDGTVIENGLGDRGIKGDGDRILHVLSGSNARLTLKKVVLRYGDVGCTSAGCETGAGAVFNESSKGLTIEDSLLYENSSYCSGTDCGHQRNTAAVLAGGGGNLTVKGTVIRNNTSTCSGKSCKGAVAALNMEPSGGEFYLENSAVMNNSASCSGKDCYTGEVVRCEDNPADTTIQNTKVESNSTTCNSELCTASEIFEFDGSKDLTIDQLVVNRNSMTCNADGCSVSEVLAADGLKGVLKLSNSHFEGNNQFAKGNSLVINLDYHQSSAGELIESDGTPSTTFQNLILVDNSIGCDGRECYVSELLSSTGGDTRTLTDVTAVDNEFKCEGNGDGGTNFEGACEVHEMIELDGAGDVIVKNLNIQDNTQTCEGDSISAQEIGCNVHEIISIDETTTQLLVNLFIENNHLACLGSRCRTDELLEIDSETLRLLDSMIHGNSTVCKGSKCAHNDLMEIGKIAAMEGTTFSKNTGLCKHTDCEHSFIYGGIDILEGDLTVKNSTISGNKVSGSGGAMLVAAGSTVTLNNVTIYDNTADADGNGIGLGGGICSDVPGVDTDSPPDGKPNGICTNKNYETSDKAGVVNLGNTILAENHDNSNNPDCNGTMNSLGYNLIGQVTSGCTITGDPTGNIVGEDPLLLPLADNGGLTWTHALARTLSPALEAGDNATCEQDDQRGVERPQPEDGVCDIGAYESEQLRLYSPIVFIE